MLKNPFVLSFCAIIKLKVKGGGGMQMYHFDEKANDVIQHALSEARDLSHRYVGTEHFLLGLCHVEETPFFEILEKNKLKVDDIRAEVIKTLGISSYEGGIEGYTPQAKKCLDLSYDYAIETNEGVIMPEHLLMGIMHLPESLGFKIVKKNNLMVNDRLLQFIHKLILNKKDAQKSGLIKKEQIPHLSFEKINFESYDDDQNQVDASLVSSFVTNMVEEAKKNPYDPVLGRAQERERLYQVLSRKNKNNVCLIGEPGVGKTALIQGMANEIASGHVPSFFKDKVIYSLNIGALISGTMFRGQFEERMKSFIDFLCEDANAIAFIDELHLLMGAGSTQDKSLDAVGMLKPYLTTGKIQLIGASTFTEYEKYIEGDKAFSRRMMPIVLEEPSAADTLAILKHIKGTYEAYHDVLIEQDAIESAVYLAKRYMPNRHFPDKAIDLIDEACAQKKLQHIGAKTAVKELKYRLKELQKEKSQAILQMDLKKASILKEEESQVLKMANEDQDIKKMMQQKKMIVTAEDVRQVLSLVLKIPVTEMGLEKKRQLKDLELILKENIFGQNRAVTIVAQALRRFHLGIQSENKPLGVFLFVGPTGVGKTALCAEIARSIFGSENHLIKLDMSEYMEKHSVSKLIGSPPGYEGHREGGFLTNAVIKNPHSVIVFDEIEKAHPEVVHVLLQLMDEGRLRDGRGRLTRFNDCLIIMTSNLGSDGEKTQKIGFQSESGDVESDLALEKACKTFFQPEFINRIHEIVPFKPLDQKASEAIVHHELSRIKKYLAEKNIALSVSAPVVKNILERYRSEIYGARALIRGVVAEIENPLSLELLNEKMPKKMAFKYSKSKGIELSSK